MHKKLRRLSSFLLLLSALLVSGTVEAQVGELLGLSPFWKWRTIESTHFRVTFPEELEAVAQKTTGYFEEAHQFLSKTLFWEPGTKVQVLVIDNTDMANGLTSPVLRFGIALMVTPPDNWFSTAYYDDWLRLLVIHEYTHYLNMDATSSFWSPLRYVFGDVLLPNAIWPTWMIEGLAVYMETRFTRSGRGRSPYYDMMLRAAVESEDLNTDRFITLDKVNGPNPYYPGGETPYFFGYQLMNQVARERLNGISFDGLSVVNTPDELLGLISERSSRRVPFLINGNISNITGKSWYTLWEEWVAGTRVRSLGQLKKIKSQPLSAVARLTGDGYQTLGSAVSPDGNWIAYTQDSLDRRMGLHLRHLKTGQTRRLADKMLGASLAFTPDSKSIVFSAIRTRNTYYKESDLAVYDLPSDSIDWLSEGKRLRDPDVSRDGRWVAFTITDHATTGVGIAALNRVEGRRERDQLTLTDFRVLHMPPKYDRASTPKFSNDGKSVIFSLHRNGVASEDLVRVERETGKLSVLVADGKFNRFPAINPDGRIYFVSDASGVDNIYRFEESTKKPRIVTNATTGLAFPAWGPDGTLYGSVFSTSGWDLAKLGELEREVSVRDLAIEPPLAPQPAEISAAASSTSVPQGGFASEEYSIFPSIWPRQWFPFFAVERERLYLGGQVLGFDAVDRHRYILGLAYDSLTRKPDLVALYSNRSFGPTLQLQVESTTTGLYLVSPFLDYTRRFRVAASISHAFPFTYSVFVPSLSFSADRSYEVISGFSPEDMIFHRSYVPNFTLMLNYSNAETSRLAISAEGGRASTAGVRLYLDSGNSIWKGLLMDREHWRVSEHSVLVPSLKASWTSRSESHDPSALVVLQGRFARVLNSNPEDSLDQLAIRGYPLQTIFARAAVVSALDYRFPISRIFRGSGTNPAFLENLHGFTFVESSYLPQTTRHGARVLPSAGAGMTLGTRLLVQLPVDFTLEYDHGFREEMGAKSEMSFRLGANLSL